MNGADLSDADQAIVAALAEHGNLTKGAIVDLTEYSRNTVYTRLEVLQAGGVVECLHEPTRLFGLVEDPREDPDRDAFDRARHDFTHHDREDVEAFVAAFATTTDGVGIHLDSPPGSEGLDRQLGLMSVHLRALSSATDQPPEDLALACLKRTDGVEFEDDGREATVEMIE